MPERFEVAADQASVTVNGSMIYSRLAELLAPTGRAVANLASLPHISIAGATATGTHGSGDGNGNVATSVIAVQVAGPNGELRRIGRGDEDFAAAPISLGALGVIVAVELDLVPSFLVRQFVHNFLSWEVLQKQFDELFASAYSVSVFTDWIDHIQLWTKERTDEDPVDHAALHDGVAASRAAPSDPGRVSRGRARNRETNPADGTNDSPISGQARFPALEPRSRASSSSHAAMPSMQWLRYEPLVSNSRPI